MKGIRLKPLYFSNNEIFVKPPEFITSSERAQFSRFQHAIVSSLKDLRPHLADRKIKKDISRSKKAHQETEAEEEEVKKLSDWKRSVSPNSPLLRKYTFRRQMTSTSETRTKQRTSSHAVTFADNSPDSLKLLVNKVVGIVALERLKKKKVEIETKNISRGHQSIEENMKASIFKIHSEVAELKKQIRISSDNLKHSQEKLADIEKHHIKQLKLIKQQETEELLFVDKNKVKKTFKQGEEGQYLMFKERIRQVKQEIHKQYQEEKEQCLYEMSKQEKVLETIKYERQKYKKQMREYKEEIYHLYLRILKEGRDVRTEGMRWVIKAIWRMGQYIPVSAFPKFLDEESIFFLLETSEKELEHDFYEKKIDDMRKEVKSRRVNYSISSSRDLYKSVRSRLREMSKSVLSQPIDGKGSLDCSRIEYSYSKETANYSEITEFRAKVAQINEYVKESTDNEIKRVTDLYQISPGDAETVGLFHLIKCLVGDKVKEFNKYIRIKAEKTKRIGTILN
jgi:hypothetical protein